MGCIGLSENDQTANPLQQFVFQEMAKYDESSMHKKNLCDAFHAQRGREKHKLDIQ